MESLSDKEREAFQKRREEFIRLGLLTSPIVGLEVLSEEARASIVGGGFVGLDSLPEESRASIIGNGWD